MTWKVLFFCQYFDKFNTLLSCHSKAISLSELFHWYPDLNCHKPYKWINENKITFWVPIWTFFNEIKDVWHIKGFEYWYLNDINCQVTRNIVDNLIFFSELHAYSEEFWIFILHNNVSILSTLLLQNFVRKPVNWIL